MKVYARHIEDMSIEYHEPVFKISTPAEAEDLVRQIKRAGGFYNAERCESEDIVEYQFLFTEEKEFCCELILGDFIHEQERSE